MAGALSAEPSVGGQLVGRRGGRAYHKHSPRLPWVLILPHGFVGTPVTQRLACTTHEAHSSTYATANQWIPNFNSCRRELCTGMSDETLQSWALIPEYGYFLALCSSPPSRCKNTLFWSDHMCKIIQRMCHHSLEAAHITLILAFRFF